ncbi:DUF2723 domain-containing protein, partial [bacterium]|nr:DUF2723 domain-containing protein [bacterium]
NGLMVATAGVLWGQSTIAEVYSLNVGFTFFALALLLRWLEHKELNAKGERLLFRGLLLWGASLGIHFISAFTGVGVMALLFIKDKKVFRRRGFVFGLLGMWGIVIFLYALLPIMWARQTPATWGSINSATSWIDHCLGAQYSYRMFAFTWKEAIERFQTRIVPLFFDNWGLGATVFLVFGFCFSLYLSVFSKEIKGAARFWQLGLAWFFLWFPPLFYSLNYNIADFQAYFILPFSFSGFLFLFAMAGINKIFERSVPSFPYVGTFLFLVSLIPLSSIPGQYQKNDLSNDFSARSFVEGVFQTLPENGILISDYDGRTNALQYHRFAGIASQSRTAIIYRLLLNQDWAREKYRKLYPWVKIPKPKRKWLKTAEERVCNLLGRDLIIRNASYPVFLVKDSPVVPPKMHLEMTGPLLRVVGNSNKKPFAGFEKPFVSLPISRIANSDYGGNPFLPFLQDVKESMFPFLGRGILYSPERIPIRILPAMKYRGKPSVISTFSLASPSLQLPLLAAPSRAVFLLMVGKGIPSDTFPAVLLTPRYESSWGKVFPVTGLRNYKSFEKMQYEFVRVPLDSSKTPKFLEVRTITPPRSCGVVIFGATQELFVSRD